MRFYGPSRGWKLLDLAELWRYRELAWAFGMRDLQVRYRQTAVGIAWAVIQPLLTVIVFGVLISWLRGTASSGAAGASTRIRRRFARKSAGSSSMRRQRRFSISSVRRGQMTNDE